MVREPPERTKAGIVFNSVDDFCSLHPVANFTREFMPVMPALEGALRLDVLKIVILLITCNLRFGSKAERQKRQRSIGRTDYRTRSCDGVVIGRIGRCTCRRWRHKMRVVERYAHPCRHQPRQVVWIAEETKHLFK